MNAERIPLASVYRRGQYAMLAGSIAVIVGLSLVVSSSSAVNLLDLWLVYSIAALGFYWIFAFGGRFAFCQTFMMALGGYSAAWLNRNGVSFAFGVLGAVACTAVAAAVIGVLLWRAENLYFALGTLAVTEIGLVVFGKSNEFTGINGNVTGIGYPELFGVELRTDGEIFWLLASILALLLMFAVFLDRSPVSRDLAATRAMPMVARSSGVAVGRIRLAMFVLGSATGGLSGALITHWQGFIGIDSFGLELGIGLFLVVILGGVTSHWGVLIGAGFFVAVPELLSGARQYMPIVYGLLLLVTIVAFPGGLASIGNTLKALRGGTRIGKSSA